MTTALASRKTPKEALDQIEKVVITGDLATLTPNERIAYYARVCESLGINPLTRPFDYITLNGKLTLYARKDATDQLRAIKGISIDRLEREQADDLAIVTAYGHDKGKRTDSAIGAVAIAGLRGEALANALMKAESKSKRRLTLSLAGLGWLDETEVDSIEESGPTVVVTNRTEAVQARLEALTAPAENIVADPPEAPPGDPDPEDFGPDEIPFDSPRSADGDPWMRRLHAVATERGMDHAALHNLAVVEYGVASLTELDRPQRSVFMAEVEARPIASPSDTGDGGGGEPGRQHDQVPTPIHAPRRARTAAAARPETPSSPSALTPLAESGGASVNLEVTLDEATKAVYSAALAHGIVPPGSVTSPEQAWVGIDALARTVFDRRDPETLTPVDWTELAAQISAGSHDPSPVRPRRVSQAAPAAAE